MAGAQRALDVDVLPTAHARPRRVARLGVGLSARSVGPLRLLVSVLMAGSPTVSMAPSAQAQAQGRVVLAGTEHAPTLARLLAADLRTAGLEVVHAELRSNHPEALMELARSRNSLAAIHFEPTASHVDLWIADRVTGKAVFRRLPRGAASEGDELLAIRAVELLRASLLELQLPELPEAEVLPPNIPKLLPEPPEGSRERPAGARGSGLRLEVAPCLLFSPGGVGFTPQSLVALQFLFADYFALRGQVQLPVWPAVVHGGHGEASVSIASAAAGVDWLLAPRRSRAQAQIGLLLGGTLLRSSGITPDPKRNQHVNLPLPTWLVHTSFGYRLNSRLSAFVRGSAGASLSRAVIQFEYWDERRQLRKEQVWWGPPLYAATAGLRIALD